MSQRDFVGKCRWSALKRVLKCGNDLSVEGLVKAGRRAGQRLRTLYLVRVQNSNYAVELGNLVEMCRDQLPLIHELKMEVCTKSDWDSLGDYAGATPKISCFRYEEDKGDYGFLAWLIPLILAVIIGAMGSCMYVRRCLAAKAQSHFHNNGAAVMAQWNQGGGAQLVGLGQGPPALLPPAAFAPQLQGPGAFHA